MNETLKEMIKKQLSGMSEEELLDILSEIVAFSMSTYLDSQSVQSGPQKAIDAINSGFKELVKNEIDTSVSPLTAKIRNGGI